jgi:serine O-acetyltransferase
MSESSRTEAEELLPSDYGLWALIWSDYRRHYAYKSESPRQRAMLSVPRIATNSSLHATVLARLIHGTSPRLTWLWRRLLLALHGCDINPSAVFGPGLMMPHPTGIVIGPNTVIGRNAVIQHLVSIGPVTTNWRSANRAGAIHIGDDVTVFPGAFILGELTVGDGAVIGAKALVTRDIPAGHIVNLHGATRLATDEERGGYKG